MLTTTISKGYECDKAGISIKASALNYLKPTTMARKGQCNEAGVATFMAYKLQQLTLCHRDGPEGTMQ
jgi:hypothetical protein